MLRLVLIVSLAVTAFGARLPSRHFASGGRIAGGENATIQEVPYQVAILWNNYFNCGGSILSATVIISSAQCVIAPPNLYKVRAGTNQNANGVGQTVDVSSYIVHDQFDPLELDYDISLLFLSTALNLDGVTMAPIALPSQGQTVADGTSALTSGWGALAVDGSFPTTLQKVSIPIFNQASCLTIYEEMEWPVSDRMICAGLDEGGKDSCQGDTGGPLVINSQLIGITSWGLLCAFPGYPGVWTRVPFFVDWINQNAGL